MAIARVKVWGDEVLTASDLNAEFDNINTFLNVAASTTAAGILEVATAAEVNTGTDAGRAVSPDGLAGSNLGIRYVQVECFAPTTDVATGDGKRYFIAPAAFSGMNMVAVGAFHITAGVTGTCDIQIHNLFRGGGCQHLHSQRWTRARRIMRKFAAGTLL